MPGYYVLKPSGTQYHFNLHADNNQVILSSERYTTKQGARNGIASCQQNCLYDDRYKRLTTRGGEPYFTLHAANGQVIGVSESYSSTTARENGINSVKTNGSTPVVHDRT